MPVNFHSEARREALEAHDWYETKRPGLGADFELCLEVSLDQIEAAPGLAPIIYRDIRRKTMSRFPFGIYYLADQKEEPTVLAVRHFSRSPRQARRVILRRLK